MKLIKNVWSWVRGLDWFDVSMGALTTTMVAALVFALASAVRDYKQAYTLTIVDGGVSATIIVKNVVHTRSGALCFRLVRDDSRACIKPTSFIMTELEIQ